MALRKPSREVKNFNYPVKYFSTWAPMLDAKRGIFENIGILFHGEVDDNEVYCYEGYFRFLGGKNCPYPNMPQTEDGEAYCEFQMLTLVPKDGNPGMHPDNKYYSTLLAPDPSVKKWEVIDYEDKVEWISGDSKYTLAPPYFHMEGTFGGLKRDGVLIPYDGQASFTIPYEKASEYQSGNYNIKGSWEGTVTINGVEKEVKNGSGELIYLILGNGYDNYAASANTSYYYWIQFSSEIFSMYSYYGDIKDGLQNVINAHVEGKPVDFFPGQFKIEDTEYYVEPGIAAKLPCRWTITAENEQGKLDLDMRARGRAHFTTVSNGGSQYYTGAAVHLNGTFTYPDGRVVKIEDVVGYVERGTPAVNFTPPTSWDW